MVTFISKNKHQIIKVCLILLDGSIDVPPMSAENHFVYSLNNGIVYEATKVVDSSIIDYDSAQQFCGLKNSGTLANVDSLLAQESIRKVMASHISSYNYQSPKFLVGLSRHGDVWSFANNLPLGSFMIWADE